jgi:Cft2 family RNA processing exonuclease
VVVSSLTDMTVGPAKDLFLEWCSHPGNTVLFTSKGKRGTLASVIRKTRKHGGHSEFILDVPVRHLASSLFG